MDLRKDRVVPMMFWAVDEEMRWLKMEEEGRMDGRFISCYEETGNAFSLTYVDHVHGHLAGTDANFE